MTPRLAIWKGFPFRYRDVARGTDNALEVIQFTGGPFYQVIENSKGPDSIRIQAVFLGPTAAVEKAAFNLIANLPGPGVLIHPELGIMTAYLRSSTVSSTGPVEGFFANDLEFLPLVDIPGTEIAFAATVSALELTMLAVGAASLMGALPDDDGGAAAVATTDANFAASTALASIADLVTGEKQNEMTLALGVAGVATVTDTVDAWKAVAALVDTRAAAETGLDAIVTNWNAAIALQETDYTQGLALTALYEFIAGAFMARLGVLVLAETFETYNDAADAAAKIFDQMGGVIERLQTNSLIGTAIQIRAQTYSGLMTDALKLPQG